MIELKTPVAAFEALSHEARLAILRRLIPAGPQGVHAGALAEALDLVPNRLSFHLNRLTSAGLVESRRAGRNIYYSARYAALGDLVRFLIDDCCAAAPEGCLPDCPRPPKTMSSKCSPTCGKARRSRKRTGKGR